MAKRTREGGLLRPSRGVAAIGHTPGKAVVRADESALPCVGNLSRLGKSVCDSTW